MDERRELPRWKVKKETKVWMPQTQTYGQCIVEDLHSKGMCVSFNKEIPNENPFRMSFSIGGEFAFIKIEADIPWRTRVEDRYVYGLAFSRIADEDKEKIYQYISANCYDQLNDKWWDGVGK